MHKTEARCLAAELQRWQEVADTIARHFVSVANGRISDHDRMQRKVTASVQGWCLVADCWAKSPIGSCQPFRTAVAMTTYANIGLQGLDANTCSRGMWMIARGEPALSPLIVWASQ